MIYNGINFNGTHYTHEDFNDFQVWCSWDDTSDVLYIGERMLALVKVWANAKPSVRVISYTNGTILRAVYNCDANGYFILDVTDIMRTYTKNDEVYVYIRRSADPDTEGAIAILEHYNTDKIFLRNPQTFPIPPTDLSDMGAVIAPPRRMYVGGNDFLWWDNKTMPWQWRRRGSDADTEWAPLNNGDIISIGGGYIEISDGYHGILRRAEETAMPCEVRLAKLRWQSLVGSYKLHNFEIKSQKTDVRDDYSLLMADNSYREIKGSEESLIFSIDELDTYDLWYYSDILTSSDVRLISADGTSYAAGGRGGICLEITTKSVTMPSGYLADGKIEFEAKIKRYDAVTL